MCFAASMMLAACGGGSSSSDLPVSSDPTAEKALDKTVDKPGFSFSYPSAILADDVDYGDLGVLLSKDEVDLDVKLMYSSGNVQEEVDNRKDMMSRAEQNPEAPVVKGNAYVIKATSHGKTLWAFGIVKTGSQIFATYSYPADEASEYEKYLGAIMKSVTIK